MQYYTNPDQKAYNIISGSVTIPAGSTLSYPEFASGRSIVLGTLNYTKIDSGATLVVQANGVASWGVVEAGGALEVQAGGSAVYWDVYGAEVIDSGASAYYSTIEQGVTSELTSGATSYYFDTYGRQLVDAGATAYYTTVEQGATAEDFSGGAMYYVDVYGSLTVDAGAKSFYTTIENGGNLVLHSGATLNYTIIPQGVSYEPIAGVTLIGAEVSGALTVDANVTETAATIEAGGVVTLNSGAIANGIMFMTGGQGGRLIVNAGVAPLSGFQGFGLGDSVDFTSLAYSATGGVTFAGAPGSEYGSLKLTEGGVSESFAVSGDVVDPVFVTRSDGNGGTLLSVETAYVAPTPTHANDLARSGDVTGPYNFIDALNLEAGYGDLISAFGTNAQAMQNWIAGSEGNEKRSDNFDGLDYVASYGDLIAAFKGAGSQAAILDAGAAHYIQSGVHEGRSISFNSLDYIASYGDLIKAFGVNGDAGAMHYIENGVSEGRSTTFDGLDYIASYADLMKAFGANEQAGAEHYIKNGNAEGRTTTFDGLDYIAGYGDLMKAFGANADAGASHYIQNGYAEGRSAKAFDVAAYEAVHTDLQGKYASADAFLTAYINYYVAHGTALT